MKKILIKFIEFYKKTISPWLSLYGVHCKYEPTCSEYTKQAIERYGECNTFSKGGYDPLK